MMKLSPGLDGPLSRRSFLFQFSAIFAAMALGRTLTSRAKWDPGPLTGLYAGGRVDLNETLPRNVARGGVFSVDATGLSLPKGVSLQPDGWLVADVSAAGASVSNVVFSYEEPS
jgi:hypothetical protein